MDAYPVIAFDSDLSLCERCEPKEAQFRLRDAEYAGSPSTMEPVLRLLCAYSSLMTEETPWIELISGQLSRGVTHASTNAISTADETAPMRKHGLDCVALWDRKRVARLGGKVGGGFAHGGFLVATY